MKQIVTKSFEDTVDAGRDFSNGLKGGETVCLEGDLGAGKTAFAKGMALGLGIKEPVKSPTFVIMNIYEYGSASARKFFVHVDAYRISGASELAGIGIQEYIDRSDAMVVIEWPQNAAGIMPHDCIRVEFENGENENERVIKMK